MKKQIICIILSIVVMLGVSVPVMADSAVTSSAVFEPTKGAIVVSGTVTTQRFNQYVTLEIVKPDGKTIYTDELRLPNAETSSKSYSFPPVALYAGNPTGNYTIKVTVEDIGAASDIIYYFNGADIQYLALKSVCDAIAAKSEIGLCDALLSNTDALGIDGAAFESLNEDGKTAVVTVLLDKQYILPGGYVSEEDIESLATTISQLRSDYLLAIAIGKYNDISSVQELNLWLASYGEEFSSDNVLTPDKDESKLYQYVLDASKEGAYISRISGKDIVLNINDIVDILYEESLLTILEVRHYTESKKIFENFPTIFALDLTDFRKLTKGQQGNVYSNMKGNYASCVLAGTKFNNLVDDMLDNSVSEKPRDHGSGSGGGLGGYTAPPVAPLKSEATQGTVSNGMPFPDIAGALWAQEAITSLKEKGIISGDDNGNFNPNNYVTRAEFAKMMVMITGVDATDANTAFADVSTGDWFYSYVKVAAQNGFVTGDSAGKFNPNERITREDMAVMLYRAYRIGENLGYTLKFEDSSNISEYAKEAIAFLTAKGVVNGIGNNLFSPKSNATRAEAAQLLYNALSQIGK